MRVLVGLVLFQGCGILIPCKVKEDLFLFNITPSSEAGQGYTNIQARLF